MKMVINLLLGIGMASFAEAMALGQGLGLFAKDAAGFSPRYAGGPPFLASKRTNFEKGSYETEFPLRWMQKGYVSCLGQRIRSRGRNAGREPDQGNLSVRDARRTRDGGFFGHLRFHDGRRGGALKRSGERLPSGTPGFIKPLTKSVGMWIRNSAGRIPVNALGARLAILDRSGKPTRISRSVATALALALVAVIAWLDYFTGDFSLAVFYLAPVVVATWYAGRSTGWFIGLLSAAAWLLADQTASHGGGELLRPYWNAAMLALTYGVVNSPFDRARAAPG